MLYKVKGKVKDSKGTFLSNLFVEAFHSDFGTSEKSLGNAWTDSNGAFEISFDESVFGENILERILRRRPDEHIVIRDAYRILYKSEIHDGAKDIETFDVTIEDTAPSYDPYSESFQREIASFNAIGDTVDISKINPQRSVTQMVRALSSWSYYTQPKIMELYGYPGPQVPRYPKDVPHDHTLPWNPKKKESISDNTLGNSSTTTTVQQ
jgi:hypothetical protein